MNALKFDRLESHIARTSMWEPEDSTLPVFLEMEAELTVAWPDGLPPFETKIVERRLPGGAIYLVRATC